MEFKTPFISGHREKLRLESFCPECDALMTVELEDPTGLNTQLLQICWKCGFQRKVLER
jgi:hypothetical protein